MLAIALNAPAAPATRKLAQTVSRAENTAPDLETRIRRARERGFWIVEEGDHLYRIARLFYPEDRPRVESLRRFLFERNPDAFINAKPTLLVVGARLWLPPELVIGPGHPRPTESRRSELPSTHEARAASALKIDTQLILKRDRITPTAPVSASQPGIALKASPTLLAVDRTSPIRREPPPVAPATTAYVDQLLEGTAAAQAALEDEERRDSRPGQRHLAVESRGEYRQPAQGGSGYEAGIDVRYRRETLNFGEFVVDAGLRHAHPAPGEISLGSGTGGRATLYQNHFPLFESWFADSALGVVRSPLNPLIANSYRVTLPSSLFAGAASTLATDSRQIQVYAGYVGQLQGAASQSFEQTSGKLASIAFSQALSADLTLGGQAVATRDSRDVRDHETLAVAAEYKHSPSRGRVKVEVLADTEGHRAGLVDTDFRIGNARHRFGLFHVDPRLQWAESPLANDQQGAYWRFDQSTRAYTVSFGADHNQLNVKEEPGRPIQRSDSVYSSASFRLDRRLTVGAGLSIQDVKFKARPELHSRIYSGNTFASVLTPVGIARFDASRYELHPETGPRDRVDSLSWSQDWRQGQSLSVSSTLTHARERVSEVATTRSSAGLSARGPITGQISWDGSIVFGRVANPRATEENVNFSAGAQWYFARDWSANASFVWNTIDVSTPLPGIAPPPTRNEKRLLLGVRYEAASGTPYATLGGAGAGSGDIRGQIFFDENGDGERQPLERGAAGVVVYLDGRYPTTTDAEGQFSFRAVVPGRHTLRMLIENLPLPWGLDDESPREIRVPLRGEASTAIPLTRIRP